MFEIPDQTKYGDASLEYTEATLFVKMRVVIANNFIIFAIHEEK
jgi:hypothetical protein